MRLRVVCVLTLCAIGASVPIGTALLAQGPGGGGGGGGGGIVTGRVTDGRTKQPIPAATVTVEGTEESAVTGTDGRFRMTRVPTGAQTLTARAIGFTSQHQVVAAAADAPAVANFVLQFSEVNLQQIVVTGTAGDQTRAANGAVVASIDAKAVVDEAPVSTVTEVLQGRVSGVNVADGSGTLGTAPKITIRGPASISLSDAPIVFIDGVRVDALQRNVVGNFHGLEKLGGQSVTALNDINPDDIESIEIVKGPAAATLYGADASAGVINIITKKGRLSARGFRQSVTAEYDQIKPNFTPYSVFGTCSAGMVQPGGRLEWHIGRRAQPHEFDDVRGRWEPLRGFASRPNLGSPSNARHRKDTFARARERKFKISFEFRRDDP